jgi:hypothetical protein
MALLITQVEELPVRTRLNTVGLILFWTWVKSVAAFAGNAGTYRVVGASQAHVAALQAVVPFLVVPCIYRTLTASVGLEFEVDYTVRALCP